MDFLSYVFLDNTLESWCIALLITALVLIVLWTLRRAFLGRICRRAKETENDLDDLIAGLLTHTSMLLLTLLAIYGGSMALTVSDRTIAWLRTIAVLALLVQAAIWGNELVTFWLVRYQKRHLASDAEMVTTVRAAGFVVRVTLFSIIVLVALDNIPGVQVTSLIASLGIGGIAVALAVQNILADLLASLSIAFDKPFAIGDFIAVGDFSGSVEHIGLKTTRLRSLSGEQLVFPNSDLLGSRIRNYKRMKERGVSFTIGVGYDTPYEKLVAIPAMIEQIITAQPKVRFGRAHLSALADFSINFDVLYYMVDADYTLFMDTKQAINLGLFKRFAEEGIEFPFPTQTLYLKHTG